LTKEVIKDAPESVMFACNIVLSDGKDVIGFLFQTKVVGVFNSVLVLTQLQI